MYTSEKNLKEGILNPKERKRNAFIDYVIRFRLFLCSVQQVVYKKTTNYFSGLFIPLFPSRLVPDLVVLRAISLQSHYLAIYMCYHRKEIYSMVSDVLQIIRADILFIRFESFPVTPVFLNFYRQTVNYPRPRLLSVKQVV